MEVLLCRDLQDRDALGVGVCSPSLATCLMGRGLALHCVCQALLTRGWSSSARWLLHTAGCNVADFPSSLPCLCGCVYALPWTRQKTEVDGSLALEVLSKTI